uniref:Uncharacterized protein n=1 Tax=viral metagenome TaxID=1070528 RepID=A0A6C0IX75_9ZZZZ
MPNFFRAFFETSQDQSGLFRHSLIDLASDYPDFWNGKLFSDDLESSGRQLNREGTSQLELFRDWK